MNDNVQDANNDGISIIDIIFLLLNRKMIIFWIVTVVVCVSLLYALSIKRVYQAEIIVSPPSFEYVKPLDLTTDSVFKSFLEVAKSRKLQKEFFNNNILDVYLKNSDDTPSIKDINNAFESFSKSIKFNINKKTNFVKVTLEGIYKNKVDIWLDNFIKMADQETVDKLVGSFELDLDLKIKRLSNNILNKLVTHSKINLSEINRLQEDYQIAKTLGGKGGDNVNDLPLRTKDYIRGAKILKAEIDLLKSRDVSQFTTAGIYDLEEKIANLNFLKIDKKTVKTVYIDTKAVGTTNIIRPDKRSIVMFSFIFGVFLAILVVFIIEFNHYIRRKRGLEIIKI